MVKLQLACTLFLVACALVAQGDAACNCNVQSNGEYCGTELNRLNRNSDCTRDQYMCGPTTRNRAAVVVKKCRPGFECDVSRDGYGKRVLDTLVMTTLLTIDPFSFQKVMPVWLTSIAIVPVT